jgi:hypothetical protein
MSNSKPRHEAGFLTTEAKSSAHLAFSVAHPPEADLKVSPASRRNSVLFSKRSTRLVAGALMKAICFFLTTTLLISGCTQVDDQFYSKKNFTSESFRADASECKRQNPSFVAIQSYVADSRDRTSNIDDAMVRDCMKAKGYNIRVLTK